MKDYERMLERNLVLAKRGYAYYIYPNKATLDDDDKQVSLNIMRFNGQLETPHFNRAVDGNWLATCRRYSLIMEMYKEILSWELFGEILSR